MPRGAERIQSVKSPKLKIPEHDQYLLPKNNISPDFVASPENANVQTQRLPAGLRKPGLRSRNQRVRISPASTRSRVSKARLIWVRSA